MRSAQDPRTDDRIVGGEEAFTKARQAISMAFGSDPIALHGGPFRNTSQAEDALEAFPDTGDRRHADQHGQAQGSGRPLGIGRSARR